MSRRGEVLLAALLLGLFFIAGLIILPLPFTRDQGIYAYNAWRWLGDAALYRDTFDHKGPLLYVIYAVALKISGGAMWGPNLMDILARTATVALAIALGRWAAGRRAGLLCGLVTSLPLLGVFNSCWWNAQAETFIMPFAVLSSLLVIGGREGKNRAALLLAGVAAAGMALLKINSALHAVFLAGWILYDGRKESGGFGQAIVFSSGFLVAMLAAAAWMAARGSLLAMWECTVTFNSFHAAEALHNLDPSALLIFHRRYSLVFGLIPLAALPAILSPGPEKGRRAVLFLFFWIASAFVTFLTQGRFFLYHFLLLIPPVCILAGLGLEKLCTLRPGNRAVAALAAGFLLWQTYSYARTYYLIQASYRTADYLEGKISLIEYYSIFSDEDVNGRGDFNLLASAAAAAYIREHTPEGSAVLVFGYEPLVNYLAARPAPGRFEIDYPLTFDPPGARAAQTRAKWRREFMADLGRAAPAMVVIVDNDTNALERKTSREQAAEFPEFMRWLNGNYAWEAEIEDFTFYSPRR